MDNNQLENEKSMRRFLNWKYFWDNLSLALILTTLVFCAWFRLIDTCTTSTIFGAVVGYFLAGIKKIHEK